MRQTVTTKRIDSAPPCYQSAISTQRRGGSYSSDLSMAEGTPGEDPRKNP